MVVNKHQATNQFRRTLARDLGRQAKTATLPKTKKSLSISYSAKERMKWKTQKRLQLIFTRG